MPRRRLRRLQQLGDAYAEALMQNYNNDESATKIENWRNRITREHDVDKIRNSYPNLNYRQLKQIVEYAKTYIRGKINEYYRVH